MLRSTFKPSRYEYDVYSISMMLRVFRAKTAAATCATETTTNTTNTTTTTTKASMRWRVWSAVCGVCLVAVGDKVNRFDQQSTAAAAATSRFLLHIFGPNFTAHNFPFTTAILYGFVGQGREGGGVQKGNIRCVWSDGSLTLLPNIKPQFCTEPTITSIKCQFVWALRAHAN